MFYKEWAEKMAAAYRGRVLLLCASCSPASRHVRAAARTRVAKTTQVAEPEANVDASVARERRDGRRQRTRHRSLDKMLREGRDAKAAVWCSSSLCVDFGGWKCPTAEQEHGGQGGNKCRQHL